MTAFERATAVRAAEPGIYEGGVDEDWWVVRAPHGGYLASIVLRAMVEAVGDPARAPRSFTIHYVAPAIAGPIRIRATIERRGRSLSQVSARAEQPDGTVALALAAFSTPWEPGIEFDAAPMPEVAAPEDGFRVPSEGDGLPPFLKQLDIRAVIGEAPFSGARDALTGGWMRLREPVAADAVVVATLADTLAPAVWPRASAPVITPTIDLSIHFRSALPLAGARPDDFILGRFRSTLAREGFFEEDGEMWAPDGTLIAQSRQLALVLPTR